MMKKTPIHPKLQKKDFLKRKLNCQRRERPEEEKEKLGSNHHRNQRVQKGRKDRQLAQKGRKDRQLAQRKDHQRVQKGRKNRGRKDRK